MGDTTDADLVAQARAGRQAAFSELLLRHREPVYRMTRTYIGDASEALDLTQEVFAAAFAALARYDPARPFRVWLSRIAINKCHDWARRRAVRSFFSRARPIDEALHVGDPAPRPDRTAEDRDALQRLEQAIAKLPAGLKAPLLLRTIEGLSQAETALTLDVSEKAVELRVYRARIKLTEMLRD
ncbi:RNA polymerase sigma factor [Sphingomonas sp. MMS24-J13]|uniref:RNA polymerase sigma factor n=1 Tax=Sphingomonas sp. MMS24-J13 TaxID=3238686 RepID=UPI003850FADC